MIRIQRVEHYKSSLIKFKMLHVSVEEGAVQRSLIRGAMSGRRRTSARSGHGDAPHSMHEGRSFCYSTLPYLTLFSAQKLGGAISPKVGASS